MTLKEIIKDPSTKFIDVRTPGEYMAGHVEGAVNIPLDQIHSRIREVENRNGSPVVLYCRSGNRSASALSIVQQKGVKNVYNGGSIRDVQRFLSDDEDKENGRKSFLSNWSFMRIFRMVAGIAFTIFAFVQRDVMLGLAGGVLVLLAATNTGQCGIGGCSVPARPLNRQVPRP